MGQMSKELLSTCCGAPKYPDWETCSECLEHADFSYGDED